MPKSNIHCAECKKLKGRKDWWKEFAGWSPNQIVNGGNYRFFLCNDCEVKDKARATTPTPSVEEFAKMTVSDLMIQIQNI